jgi:hypothetical protein
MPPQYEYQKSVLGYRGTKTELEEVLIQRYSRLLQAQKLHGFKCGMHLHLALHPNDLMPEDVHKQVNDCFKWFKNKLNRAYTTIAFGWFKDGEYARRLCETNSIRIVHDVRGHICIHDYDLPMSKLVVFEKWLKGVLRNCRRWVSRKS